MIRNYIKIALRSLWRKKTFAFLNILGLAVGMASALLVFLVIRHEMSYDTYHSKLNRVYRVGTDLKLRSGEVDHYGATSILLPDAFRVDFPSVERVAATWQIDQAQFAIPKPGGDQLFREKTGVYYVEPGLFDILDIPWLEGDPATALRAPFTVALSRSVAKKWFGDWHKAMGQTVRLGDDGFPVSVTGILEDPPSNTDISLNIVLSYATFRRINAIDFNNPRMWGSMNSSSECFVLLHQGQDPQTIEAGLPAFTKAHYAQSDVGGTAKTTNTFLPVKDMHFDEDRERYGDPNLSHKELWALSLIGIFLVLVACINFVNLSTAQSTNRAKEIGVRKVLGSNRPQLLTQFFLETALLTLVAMVLACILTELSLPLVGRLLNRDLSLSLFQVPLALLFLLGIGVIVTFLAGFYPGLILSGFDPVDAIKSKMKTTRKGGISLRRGLVVLQFVIAQLLIIATLVVIKQMSLYRNRPMGFERSAIVMIDLPADSLGITKYLYFKDKISRLPGVLQAALADSPPSTDDAWNTSVFFDTRPQAEDKSIMVRYADTDYLRTFKMTLAAGREPYPSDTIREVLVNETAVKMFGLHSDEEVLGRTVKLGALGQYHTIVGVIKDFNDRPLNDNLGIRPLVVAPATKGYTLLAVHLDPVHQQAVLNALSSTYAEVFPEHVFDPRFVDDELMKNYRAEATAGKLFRLFAVLAIFISCLGLYGLVSFMAAQKTKEVGIRKVLGASVQSIVILFSKEFTLLIGVAFVVAAPLGYYFMTQWLSSFYYQTDIGWGVFALAILLSVIIAWATVGYRALRAALSDPVKAIKYE
ncbi:ABC transporter permease [Dinghuibacter silviterrae]|uniref:Putative permease n=1 Tax=Dinghuibacter silviterrae TaxID=1539049 RepID=A0A4R8DPP0_9BACT|nr:ABC transporter permease [Dinghuibacter silviterrae]TDW99715.1 putative permease [Dinghuibacter silviterrae]